MAQAGFLKLLVDMRTLGLAVLLAHSALVAQPTSFFEVNRNRPILDAHNCYPYDGQWNDRLDRALKTGYPVGIEQDLAWASGRVVVSHKKETTGQEPTLREYFFEHVRPIVEKALQENNRSSWPLIILHFDMKDNQPALLHAVW